jgi:hypothetical protein
MLVLLAVAGVPVALSDPLSGLEEEEFTKFAQSLSESEIEAIRTAWERDNPPEGADDEKYLPPEGGYPD